MFDILKKKLTGFIDNLTKKKEDEHKEPVKKLPETEIAPEKSGIEERPTEESVIEQKTEQPTISEKPIIVEKEQTGKTIKKPEPKISHSKLKQDQDKTKETEPQPKTTVTASKETKTQKEKKPAPFEKKEEEKIDSTHQTDVLKQRTENEKMKPVEETPHQARKYPPLTVIRKEPVKKEQPQTVKKPDVIKPVAVIQKEHSEIPEKRISETGLTSTKEKQTKDTPKPEVILPELSAEKKKEIKLGAFEQIKSLITQEVEIKENEVADLLDALELELLEGDVDLEVSEAIRRELSEKLIGTKIRKKELHAHIENAIGETLTSMMENKKAFSLIERIDQSEKPVKIVFLGINGAGKTTTIAKFAKMLMDKKYGVIFAASDTFRAAAIEQMEVHASRLGVKLIKRDYGADPTSVAYDAMNYAKSHGIEVVLIDTAGRQDTNINLINELKKMDRVIKPDLKLYIGESIAGSVIIEQVNAFHREIGLDGVVLTKLDCDPKGGTVLSINKATGVPILFIGTGQNYDDLEEFSAKKIIDKLISREK